MTARKFLHGCPLSLDAELNVADHADRRNFYKVEKCINEAGSTRN